MAWQASHYQAHVDDLAACGDGEAGANDATNGPASARKQDDAGHQQTLGEHLDFQTDDAPGTVAIIISIFTAANALASCDGPDDALSRVSHGCFSAKPAARASDASPMSLVDGRESDLSQRLQPVKPYTLSHACHAFEPLFSAHSYQRHASGASFESPAFLRRRASQAVIAHRYPQPPSLEAAPPAQFRSFD